MSDPLAVIVDGSNLMIRSHFASQKRQPDGTIETLTTSDGRESGALFFSIKHLISVVENFKPSHLVYFYDHGRSSFRSGIRDDYKANRGPRDFDLTFQFDAFDKFLSLVDVWHYREKNVEADDLIAKAAIEWQDRVPVMIVSADHDLRQLVNDRVNVLKPSMGSHKNAQEVFFTSERVEEKHGLPPHRLAEMWALTGDDGDNIKGLFRVGEKTAKKMLDRHGDLLEVIKYDPHFEGDPDLVKQVVDNYRMIHLDGTLAQASLDLCDAAWDPTTIDRDDLRTFLQYWEFNSLVQKLEQHGTLFGS